MTDPAPTPDPPLTRYSARRPLIHIEDAEIMGTEVYLAAEVDARLAALQQERALDELVAESDAERTRDIEARNVALAATVARLEAERDALRTERDELQSDFDAFVEHHKATEAQVADLTRQLSEVKRG